MMPGILQQMGADNLQSLRKLAEQLPAEARNAAASQAATAEDDEEGKPSALLAVYLSQMVETIPLRRSALRIVRLLELLSAFWDSVMCKVYTGQALCM